MYILHLRVWHQYRAVFVIHTTSHVSNFNSSQLFRFIFLKTYASYIVLEYAACPGWKNNSLFMENVIHDKMLPTLR